MAVFYKPNIYPLFWFQSSTAFSLAFKSFTSNPEVRKEQCTVILIQRMQRKRVLHCCRCTYAMQTVFVCVCACVRECVWEHRLQESTQVLNGLNTGKNATASIVQVTIPVNCAAFSSLIDRHDVWWFKTICTFWERECAWWFTHAVYEIISQKLFKLL